jgi:hypothetical protein
LQATILRCLPPPNSRAVLLSETNSDVRTHEFDAGVGFAAKIFAAHNIAQPHLRSLSARMIILPVSPASFAIDIRRKARCDLLRRRCCAMTPIAP